LEAQKLVVWFSALIHKRGRQSAKSEEIQI